MKKIIWVLIGIICIAIGGYTIIPQGLGWWEELVELLKGVIGILLIVMGAFCLFIAKID